MTDDIILKYYEIPAQDNPSDFFAWCLKKKLYKYDGGVNFSSRLNAVYSGLEPFQGVSAIIAYKKSRPVGISLCEHRNQEKLKLLVDFHNLGFDNLGFLNIYIKSSHRKNGLATYLMNQMENFRINAKKNEYLNKEIEINPVFVCRGLAKKIVQDKSKYTFAVGSEFDSRGSDIELHNIAFHKKKPDLNTGYEIKLKEKIDLNEVVLREFSYKESVTTKAKALKVKI